jgi:hypothetical protein
MKEKLAIREGKEEDWIVVQSGCDDSDDDEIIAIYNRQDRLLISENTYHILFQPDMLSFIVFKNFKRIGIVKIEGNFIGVQINAVDEIPRVVWRGKIRKIKVGE